jgi:RNA polymerase-binding transcription factor DksA
MTAKTPAHRRQLRLCIGDGDDTASHETVASREAEAVRRDVTQQPAGTNKEEGLEMDTYGACATTGDARRRHATTGDATTSQRTRGKREERGQRTRGNGASIGQGCAVRGGSRVERMRGRCINATTSRQRRDDRGGGKSNEEWKSLKAIREADGAETTTTTVDDIIGALHQKLTAR